MKYLKLFENFSGSELEEDLKWIMVNFLDDKYQFELMNNLNEKLFIYRVTGYDEERVSILENLLLEIHMDLGLYIINKYKESIIIIGKKEAIKIYNFIRSEYSSITFEVPDSILSLYKINDDMSVDVNSYINLYDEGLVEIPIKFNKVGGSFYCGGNKLTSLLGCPIEVFGNFDCSNNKLTSLEGCPKKIGGVLDIKGNRLKSLDGLPDEVKSHITCSPEHKRFITTELCKKYKFKIYGQYYTV